MVLVTELVGWNLTRVVWLRNSEKSCPAMTALLKGEFHWPGSKWMTPRTLQLTPACQPSGWFPVSRSVPVPFQGQPIQHSGFRITSVATRKYHHRQQPSFPISS